MKKTKLPFLLLFYLTTTITTTTTTTTTPKGTIPLQTVPLTYDPDHHHHDPHIDPRETNEQERIDEHKQEQNVTINQEQEQTHERGVGSYMTTTTAPGKHNDTYTTDSLRRHFDIWMERIMQSDYVKNKSKATEKQTQGGTERRGRIGIDIENEVEGEGREVESQEVEEGRYKEKRDEKNTSKSRAITKILRRGLKKKKESLPKPNAVDQSCLCGQYNSRRARIVEGQETDQHAYPWMVSLQVAKERLHFCGCSIITQRYVLTAAHCTEGFFPFELVVRVGDHNLQERDSSREKTINVATIIEHPGYDVVTSNNDIALIKLAEPLAFTWRVSPICLTPPDLTFYREKVTVIGWGKRFEKDKQEASILRHADLKVLPMSHCRHNFKLESEEVTSKMICAYSSVRDSCQGDSGGPLVWLDTANDRYFIVGVTSWGVGCGLKQYPGVYTKVSKFLSWIYEETGRSPYCRSYVPKPDNKKIRKYNNTKGRRQSGVIGRMVKENGTWIYYKGGQQKNAQTDRKGKQLTKVKDKKMGKKKEGKGKVTKKGKKTKKGMSVGGKKKWRSGGKRRRMMKKGGEKEKKRTRHAGHLLTKDGRKGRKERKWKRRNGLRGRRKKHKKNNDDDNDDDDDEEEEERDEEDKRI